jgi:hypothetical protein
MTGSSIAKSSVFLFGTTFGWLQSKLVLINKLYKPILALLA